MTTTRRFEKAISYDATTRDFALYLDGELVGWAKSYLEGEETLDALVYDILNPKVTPVVEEAVNALGEPMPASADEALARQLVGEINELAAMIGEWAARPELREAYDRKSAQVRALGYEVGPDGAGALCVWRKDNTGPLLPTTPAEAAVVGVGVYEPAARAA